MSDYFHKIMSKYRRVILFLTDFVIVCSAYLFTWVLISGRARYERLLQPYDFKLFFVRILLCYSLFCLGYVQQSLALCGNCGIFPLRLVKPNGGCRLFGYFPGDI